MTFPRFRPVADRAVLVEFGETIADAIHAQVLRLDRLLTAKPPEGMAESVPAYASVLITFDPITTDHPTITRGVESLLQSPAPPETQGQTHTIRICYDADLATDLPEVARQTGLTHDEIIAAHLSGDYKVYLYGFAPGYAYMAGVPAPLLLPRKPAAVRDVPAGRVIIAGPQCIITTLKMPTGWWVIGASPDLILQDDPQRPFRFAVGDQVRFRRISRAEHDAG